MSKPIEVDFNPELFNNLYWHLKSAYSDPKIRYIWIYGGSSASKTFTAVQADLTESLESGTSNTMVFRKYGSDIIDSIYSDYKGIIGDWGMNEVFKCQQNLIKCSSGSRIRFRGMDDPEKIKGLTRVRKIVLEEISQFDEADLKQVRKRLRGRKNQQIVALFNPVSEDHWIKTNIFDKDKWVDVDQKTEAKANGFKYEDWKITEKKVNEKGNAIIIRVTYQDNKYIIGPHFVDQHVIDDFEFDKAYDYNEYRVYALGEWGKIRTGGEFYKHFSEEKHVKDCIYNPDLPIHMAWDENVNPYLPVGIFQLQGKEIRQIDEIAGIDPDNTITAVCNEFKRRYPAHRSGLFIYGDSTSNKQDVKIEKGYDFFKLVMRELEVYKPQKRVSKSNPSVVMRGNFINTVLFNNFKGIVVKIAPKCKNTILDFINVKTASDGRKHKQMEKNPKTEITFQKWGHFTDLFDYLICEAFKTEYSEYENGDKRTDKRPVGQNVQSEKNRF